MDIRWDWINDHWDDIGRATAEHLLLVGLAVGLATLIAVPLAVLVRRSRLARAIATGGATVFYTIPSLALFAIMVAIIGIGRMPAVIALAGYGVGIILRNTLTGLREVPTASLEAARGMGLTPRQILGRVELPLAVPAILAGLRLATLETVAIGTIAVFVAAGGLGSLIYTNGIQRDLFLTPIAVGSVIAVALALALDRLWVLAQRLATPWARARATR